MYFPWMYLILGCIGFILGSGTMCQAESSQQFSPQEIGHGFGNESPSASHVGYTPGQLYRASRHLCIPRDLASLESHFTGLLGSIGGCWGRAKPLSCPLAWAESRIQGLFGSWGVCVPKGDKHSSRLCHQT